MKGIFEGIRVIEIGSFVAAPAAATIFADFGANVIKIEQPGLGDPWRHQYSRPEVPKCDKNFFWILTGRSKRSVGLDLKNPEGRAIMNRLVAKADVFVTNMPLPARDRLGITYEQLSRLNQRLVYGSFTGYGETGAESDEVAFDTTAWWARSGLMDLVRSEPDGPPARSIVGMGDHMASLAMFGAVVTALYDREKTGRGAYVGSSLMANGAWSNAASIQASLCGGEPPRAPSRAKNPNPMNNHYLCSDGRWFSLTMNVAQQERFWPQFAAFMEKPVLVDDERFNTPKARWDNPEALIAVLDDGFARKAASEWKVLFHGLGFAVAVVAHCGDLQSDEQMLANGVLIPMAEGDHLTVNSPIWVAGREKVAPRRAPEVGENTSEVLLQDLMIDAAELDRLRRAGVAS